VRAAALQAARAVVDGWEGVPLRIFKELRHRRPHAPNRTPKL